MAVPAVLPLLLFAAKCSRLGRLPSVCQAGEGSDAAKRLAARLWTAVGKLQSPFHIGRVVQAAVHVDGPDSLSVRGRCAASSLPPAVVNQSPSSSPPPPHTHSPLCPLYRLPLPIFALPPHRSPPGGGSAAAIPAVPVPAVHQPHPRHGGVHHRPSHQIPGRPRRHVPKPAAGLADRLWRGRCVLLASLYEWVCVRV